VEAVEVEAVEAAEAAEVEAEAEAGRYPLPR
jgi:hypothetical protein